MEDGDTALVVVHMTGTHLGKYFVRCVHSYHHQIAERTMAKPKHTIMLIHRPTICFSGMYYDNLPTGKRYPEGIKKAAILKRDPSQNKLSSVECILDLSGWREFVKSKSMRVCFIRTCTPYFFIL